MVKRNLSEPFRECPAFPPPDPIKHAPKLDTLLVRGRMNDREALARGADDAFGLAAGECDAAWFADLERCVLRRAALLFAVVFWVTVLGFGAALLLVLNRAWLARNPDGGDWARSLDAALCWIPARLTTLALWRPFPCALPS